MLEAADADDLEDSECRVGLGLSQGPQEGQEAVMAVGDVAEVGQQIITVVGGVPRAAQAALEALTAFDRGHRWRGNRGVGLHTCRGRVLAVGDGKGLAEVGSKDGRQDGSMAMVMSSTYASAMASVPASVRRRLMMGAMAMQKRAEPNLNQRPQSI